MDREVQFVNLTGHDLVFDNTLRKVLVEGHHTTKLKVYSHTNIVDRLVYRGVVIPLLESTEQRILDLPDPQEGVIYVVSGIVAHAAQRDDIVCPSRMTRDEGSGRVISAKAVLRPRREVDPRN